MKRLQMDITGIGLLDVGDETNSPVRLNKKLSDISLIRKRSDVFTYDFEVKDSQDNRNKLQYFYHYKFKDVNSINQDLDAKLLINGRIFQQGTVRIKSSKVTDDIRTFKFAFKAGNIDWWTKLKDFTLIDLDWSGIPDTKRNLTNIPASWSNVYTDAFAYAAIDRGIDQFGTHTYAVETAFHPELFISFILSKMAEVVGVTFSSTFIDDADVRKLLMSFFAPKFTFNKTTLDAHHATTKLNTTATIVSGTNPVQIPLVNGIPFSVPTFAQFNNIGTGLWVNVSDPSSELDSNGAISPTIDMSYGTKVTAEVSGLHNALPGENVFIRFFAIISSSGFVTYGTSAYNYVLLPGDGTIVSLTGYFEWGMLGIETAQIGIEVFMESNVTNLGFQFSTTTLTSLKLIAGTTVDYDPNNGPGITPQMSYGLGSVVDDNISLYDIFNDIVRLFNLYAETDAEIGVVQLETRADFYKNISEAENWSDRLDTNKPIEVTLNSTLYKRYLSFKYAKDGKDAPVEAINEANLLDYMSFRHDYGTNFNKGDVKHDLKVFAGTVAAEYWDGALDLNDPQVPPITARMWTENGTFSPPRFTDFKPRILNFVNGTQTNDQGDLRELRIGDGTTADIYTSFGVAIPYTTQGVTAPINLSFDGDDGLFNEYYGQMARIIDEGSRMVCHVFFDENKFNHANFRKPKYFEAPHHVRGYWILEQISAFDPLNPGMYQCVFLKLIPENPIVGSEQTTGESSTPGKPNLGGGFGNAGGGGGISTETNIRDNRNELKNGSLGVGIGLQSSTPFQVVTGRFNEDAPGAKSVTGNGTASSRGNSSLVDKSGSTITNPEIMVDNDGNQIYYHEDENNVKYFVYKG